MWLRCWLFAVCGQCIADVDASPAKHAVNRLPEVNVQQEATLSVLVPDATATVGNAGASTIMRRELLPAREALEDPEVRANPKKRFSKRFVQRQDARQGRPKSKAASHKGGTKQNTYQSYIISHEDQHLHHHQTPVPALTTQPAYAAMPATTPAPLVIIINATTSVASNLSYDDANANVPHRISMLTLICIIFSGTVLALWIAWRNLKKVYESRRENDIFMEMLGGIADDSTKQRASKLWGKIRGVAFTILTGDSDSGAQAEEQDKKESSSGMDDSSAKEDQVKTTEAQGGLDADRLAVDTGPRRGSAMGAADAAAGGAPEVLTKRTLSPRSRMLQERAQRQQDTAAAGATEPSAPGDTVPPTTPTTAAAAASPAAAPEAKSTAPLAASSAGAEVADTRFVVEDVEWKEKMIESAAAEPEPSPPAAGTRSRRQQAFERAGLATSGTKDFSTFDGGTAPSGSQDFAMLESVEEAEARTASPPPPEATAAAATAPSAATALPAAASSTSSAVTVADISLPAAAPTGATAPSTTESTVAGAMSDADAETAGRSSSRTAGSRRPRVRTRAAAADTPESAEVSADIDNIAADAPTTAERDAGAEAAAGRSSRSARGRARPRAARGARAAAPQSGDASSGAPAAAPGTTEGGGGDDVLNF